MTSSPALLPKKVTGVRQSERARRPSKRTVDPDNAEVASMSADDGEPGSKRKGKTVNTRRVARKVVDDDSDGDDGSKYAGSEAETDAASSEEEVDDDVADAAILNAKYTSMKALGDGDRQVHWFLFCSCESTHTLMFTGYALKA